MNDEDVIAAAVAAAVQAATAVVGDARRLGLTWTLRPATVIASDGMAISIIYDGDTAELPATSLIGNPATNARVMGLIIPPGGNYIVGRYGLEGKIATQFQDISATAQVTLTGVDQLMTGTDITVETVSDAANWEVNTNFDFRETVAGTTVALGRLYVDGVAQSKEAIFGFAATTERATIGQSYVGQFSTSGNHTFALYVSRTAANGTQIAAATHTGYTMKIFE